MLNLDQITEQGASLDLQGLVILKDGKNQNPEEPRQRTSEHRRQE